MIALPNFAWLTPANIALKTGQSLQLTVELHNDLVVTTTPTTATFENVIRPIIEHQNRVITRFQLIVMLLERLSPSSAIREAASRARARIIDATEKNYARHDIAKRVLAVHARCIKDLDPESQYLLNHLRGEYIRHGADLRLAADRNKFHAISFRLNGLCFAARERIREKWINLWCGPSDLDGVPENKLLFMQSGGVGLRVMLQNANVPAFLTCAHKPRARHQVLAAQNISCSGNINRLQEIVRLRLEVARQLRFEHYTSLKMEDKIIPNAADIEKQLEDLHQGLKPFAKIEMERLVEFKRRSHHEDSEVIYAWDFTYYSSMVKRSEADLVRFSEYFDATYTFSGMIKILSNLFRISFEGSPMVAWHPDVKCFKVFDENMEFLGHLYADLYEREGKDRTISCGDVQRDFIENDGTKNYPGAVVVSSFKKLEPCKHTLLGHGDMVVLFRAIGQAIQIIVTKTKHGLGRSRELSEIASMVLENLMWEPDVLIRIGKHHSTLTSEWPGLNANLPEFLAKQVCSTRNLTRANEILELVRLSMFDLAVHTPPPSPPSQNSPDITQTWKTMLQRFSLIQCEETALGAQKRFLDIFSTDHAGNCVYPLLMAYAADIYAVAFAKDPLNSVTGARWRREVLEHGGSRPLIELLKNFLGREPSVVALVDQFKPVKDISGSSTASGFTAINKETRD